MSTIADIKAFEILDSRGNPTLEVELLSQSGMKAVASVPSGASKGTHEAVELRDADPKRYNGLGVLKSIQIIETIIKPALIKFELGIQHNLDTKLLSLDGTQNKSVLGANTILAVSLAYARLTAQEYGIPLYSYIAKLTGDDVKKSHVTPIFNVINGGLHGSGNITIQEFILFPKKELLFEEKLQMGVELYHHLKKELRKIGKSTSLGDEGGFTPEFANDEEVLSFLTSSISTSVYTYHQDVYLGLDLAASTYYKDGSYHLSGLVKSLENREYTEYLENITRKYQLFSLEDPFYEDAWDQWSALTSKIGNLCMVIGDDLLVTNKARLDEAILRKACTGILVKVNQIGTLTETLEVIRLAKNQKFTIIISHRSGETTDDFIADLAVGTCADFVKFGAPARGERVAKYNRLLHIYKEIFPGS